MPSITQYATPIERQHLTCGHGDTWKHGLGASLPDCVQPPSTACSFTQSPQNCGVRITLDLIFGQSLQINCHDSLSSLFLFLKIGYCLHAKISDAGVSVLCKREIGAVVVYGHNALIQRSVCG